MLLGGARDGRVHRQPHRLDAVGATHGHDELRLDELAHGAFHALSQGGQVTMPLAPAFWCKTFGMLTDRFGVSWAVNGEPIPLT